MRSLGSGRAWMLAPELLHPSRIESGFFGQLLPRCVLLNQPSEAHAHFFCYCFLLCKQVMSFAWIFAQIVKLGPGRINKVIIFRFHSTQFAPVEVQAWKEGFRIEAAGGVFFLRR